MKYLLLISILLLSIQAKTQSYWFGAKGGLAMNLQSWGDGGNSGSLNRDPLFNFNGDIFIESFDDKNKGSLYASAGYHTRGSSVRFNSLNNIFSSRQGFKFHNVVLELGGKKSLGLGKEFDPYFLIGVRGEYTIGTNLDEYIVFGNLYYPNNEFVKKFNYGLTAGGGFETKLSEMSNGFFEFSIQPDLSFQYEQPPLFNVTEPFTGNKINIGLRQFRNLSLEFKVGIKFLRKVEYID